MKPILEIRDLAKKYRIKHLSGGYLSFRERIRSAFTFGGSVVEDFWALNGVSFDVLPGESIGIIGRNGAGKSTLLKILSKITPPTKGRIIARGRIASLLEVGTGFHPELSGRENIYFNGSLLGMKRREIQDKFDEIVDFSGVEKFLDTPLKHYSSGMQLRLAFSVAAFLEPEILIIDEVLAVGDAEFQKKCLGKMEDVSKRGRTILFVSHNMAAVDKLCSKAILLKNGSMQAAGSKDSVIREYVEGYSESNKFLWVANSHDVINDDYMKFEEIEISQDGLVTSVIQNSKEVIISIKHKVKRQINALQLSIEFVDSFENTIFRTFHYEVDGANSPGMVYPGDYLSKVIIPKNTLVEGNYRFVIKASNMYERMIEPKDGIHFNVTVEEAGKYVRKIYKANRGMVTVDALWHTRKLV
ncbi:MAG TPA: ABC transporter ATP-binding protein [Chryseolinea sp.]|nr:ABC transporter ATP-binding protein [Chryseolinea sp.]